MRKALTIMVVLAISAAACGDDDTTAASAVTETTSPSPTEAPATTDGPLTTEASTTTGAPTTTEASAGVQWPPEGATAVYEVTTWNGDVFDVEARIERDVEWMGDTWTVVVVGEPEEGQAGLAIYLDVSDPGFVRYKGIEGYSSTLPAGQVQREWVEEPWAVDIAEALAGPVRVEETPYFLSFTGDGGSSYGLWMEIDVVALDESIDVPFGTVDGCIGVEMVFGGPFIGPDDASFTMETWLHPEHLLVKTNEMPVFADIQLKEPWG